MKLSTVSSIFWLVPLAFAELREPYAKLLYDGGYIIAHGSDARSIQYYHEFPYPPLGDFWVVSTTGDNEHGESMFFDSTKFKFLTTSFAIDSRKGWENEHDNNDNCLSRTDKKLKYLLHGCSGRMTLRALTDEERAEVQQYKKEQQESKKPFEVIYSEGRVKIKSPVIESVYFDQIVGRHGYHTLFVNATIYGGNTNEMLVMTRPVERTLAFEGMPTERRGACGKIGLGDLLLAYCKGAIRVRVRDGD